MNNKAREGLYIRLGKSDDDQIIRAWVDQLAADGENISGAIKRVLVREATGQGELYRVESKIDELRNMVKNGVIVNGAGGAVESSGQDRQSPLDGFSI